MNALKKYSLKMLLTAGMGYVRLQMFVARRSRPLAVLAVLAGVFGAKWLVEWTLVFLYSRQLRSKRRRFQRKCAADFLVLEEELKQEKVCSEDSESITCLSTTELVEALRTDSLTPLQVLRAYQYKALEVNKRTNAITVPFLEAKYHAKALAQTKVRGPLYGIPISIKEQLTVKGHVSTEGCAYRADDIAPEDSIVVQVLRNQGAIPFMHTNLSQLTLGYDSGNPIYGNTVNPHDSSRTAGGSSGGEGALVGSGGSLIGIGTDIGGSIRNPASFCGAVGFKGTAMRSASFKGQDGNYEQGMELIWGCYGPVSRDVDGAVLVTKCLMDPEMHRLDPRVIPMPFNNQVYSDRRRLRVGFTLQDGPVAVTQPCRRAMLEAKAALERQGHELVPWDPPGSDRCAEIICKSMTADGGKYWRGKLFGDDIDPSIMQDVQQFGDPGLCRTIKMWLTSLTDAEEAKSLEQLTGRSNVAAYWALTVDVEAWRWTLIESWKAAKLDAFISPTCAMVAPTFGNTTMIFDACQYLVLFNLLDFPAGTVPVTKVTAADLAVAQDHVTSTQFGTVIQQEMVGSEGMPVGVQCVSMRYQDELCLRLMKELETALEQT